MVKSKGGSRAWLNYASRDPIGPFSDFRLQIYFKDFGEKSSQKWICKIEGSPQVFIAYLRGIVLNHIGGGPVIQLKYSSASTAPSS